MKEENDISNGVALSVAPTINTAEGEGAIDSSFDNVHETLDKAHHHSTVNQKHNNKPHSHSAHKTHFSHRDASNLSKYLLEGEDLSTHSLVRERNDFFLGGSRVAFKFLLESVVMLDALYLTLW